MNAWATMMTGAGGLFAGRVTTSHDPTSPLAADATATVRPRPRAHDPPRPFLVQECAPLRLGQLLFDEGKDPAFLVRQVIQHAGRQRLNGRRQLTAAAQRGIHPASASGIWRCSATMASTDASALGSVVSSRRSTGHRSSSSAE